jgi:hypothetical protein
VFSFTLDAGFQNSPKNHPKIRNQFFYIDNITHLSWSVRWQEINHMALVKHFKVWPRAHGGLSPGPLGKQMKN